MADDEYILYMLRQWCAGNLYVYQGQFYDMTTDEPTGLYIGENMVQSDQQNKRGNENDSCS